MPHFPCQETPNKWPAMIWQTPYSRCQLPVLFHGNSRSWYGHRAESGTWLAWGRIALSSKSTCQVPLGLGIPIASSPFWKKWWVGLLPRGRAQSPPVHVLLRPPIGYLAVWLDPNSFCSVSKPNPSLVWLDWADPPSNAINFPSYIWGRLWAVCWVGSMSSLYPNCQSPRLSCTNALDATILVLSFWNKAPVLSGCSKSERLVVFIPGHWLHIHMLFVFGKWQYLQKLIATAGRTETRPVKTCVGNICWRLFFFAWWTDTSYRKN